ncbi:MAG: hypothetical protein LUE99_03085 [Bacteroides sp.]|nr:hypothetical protein [Bacteroides sp.]
MDIVASNRIANLKVTIDSETLTENILNEVGLLKNFDLAYPGSLKEGLEGLAFPTGSQVIGEKSLVFDIAQFTPLLNIYGAGTHKFIIEVIDQNGKSTIETLTLITQKKE